MEAATPLRQPSVRTVGDRLAIDGLVVDDQAAVQLVREREDAGTDPAATVTDAIEIGARVLEREQAGANTEFVRAEFGKVSKEVEEAFTDRAREVAEHFGTKVDEVFGPEGGQLAKELERHFSDGSSSAVQHRVREVVNESAQRLREELGRQFSAADGRNPLADFKKSAVDAINQAASRSDATQRALLQKLGELERQVQALKDEREKLEELEQERERGTAKGRTFEEQVAEAIDALALAHGDCADAVGDLKGATGKTGDVVVGIEAATRPPLGRVVFEAKDRRLSKPKALEELDRALAERDASFAVLVVPTENEVPASLHPLREYNGDKLIVALDPEDPSRIALEAGYRLARARVLMARSAGEEIDAAAVQDMVQRALAAMDDVRRVKNQLTGAKTSIDKAYDLVEAMAGRVRAYLGELDALVGADEAAEPAPLTLDAPAR